MEKPLALLYLHGIGDDVSRREWLTMVDERLTDQGVATLVGLGLPLVTPQYADVLKADTAAAVAPPRRPNTHPADATIAQRYRMHQSHYAAILLAHGTPPTDLARRVGFGRIPDPVDAIGERLVMGTIYDSVGRFVAQPARRAAVLQRVLRSLPADHDVIVIGHSLGAIVALDVLRHLPASTSVPLLVTAASALARRNLPQDVWAARYELPHPRLGGWINVYNPRDAVTRGRGIADRFPAALDVAVPGVLGDHQLANLLGAPGVAAVLGEVARGQVPQHLIGDGFLPLSQARELIELQLSYRTAEALALDRRADLRLLVAYDAARQDQRSARSELPVNYDEDLSQALRGRINERDLPAALLALVTVNPIAPQRIKIPLAADLAARRQVAIDLGVTPSWTDLARQSLAKARRSLTPGRGPMRKQRAGLAAESAVGVLAQAFTAHRLGLTMALEDARHRASIVLEAELHPPELTEVRDRLLNALADLQWPARPNLA